MHFYIFMLQRPNIIKRCESLKLSTKSYVNKKFQNEDKDIKIFLMKEIYPAKFMIFSFRIAG